MLWSWNKYHQKSFMKLNCCMISLKKWFVHLIICMKTIKLNIQISLNLAILHITTSFQEASNHLVLFRIMLCIQFQSFIGHSDSISWILHVCHKLSNNQFTFLIHTFLNSSCLYFGLVYFSNRIQVILLYRIFILIRLSVFFFILRNYQLNKDDSISFLLNSKSASKVRLDLYLKRLFIDMIWIVLVLNTLRFDFLINYFFLNLIFFFTGFFSSFESDFSDSSTSSRRFEYAFNK